jgi:hypothetical protein
MRVVTLWKFPHFDNYPDDDINDVDRKLIYFFRLLSGGATGMKNGFLVKPGIRLVDPAVFVKYYVTPEFEVKVLMEIEGKETEEREATPGTVDPTKGVKPPKPLKSDQQTPRLEVETVETTPDGDGEESEQPE